MPNRPDPATEQMLSKSKFCTKVFYLEGDPLKHKNLKRCLIEKSKAVIILSDKLLSDST